MAYGLERLEDWKAPIAEYTQLIRCFSAKMQRESSWKTNEVLLGEHNENLCGVFVITASHLNWIYRIASYPMPHWMHRITLHSCCGTDLNMHVMNLKWFYYGARINRWKINSENGKRNKDYVIWSDSSLRLAKRFSLKRHGWLNRRAAAAPAAAAQRISIIYYTLLSFFLLLFRFVCVQNCGTNDGFRFAIDDVIWFDARKGNGLCILLVKSQPMSTWIYITNHNL